MRSQTGIGIVFVFLIIVASILSIANYSNSDKSKRYISFTFDDGSTSDMPNLELKQWNNMILTAMKKHKLQSMFFVTGNLFKNEKGKYVLDSWIDDGHLIANHTYDHLNLNSSNISLDNYINNFLRLNDSLSYIENFVKYFRYPYLREGNTIEKRDGVRNFLSSKDYKIGHVSIDVSDWYIFSKLLKAYKSGKYVDLNKYRDLYVNHMYNCAVYSDNLATDIAKRKIKHVFLIHHNLCAALFFDDLLKKFKKEGWRFIDPLDAFKDEFYSTLIDNIPAGGAITIAKAIKLGGYMQELKNSPTRTDLIDKEMQKLGM
jgi:peptidoglycan/xylan/chitin deacetylase (PgdA/CDA1 family)